MGRINTKNIDLGSALLQQGKAAVGTGSIAPAEEVFPAFDMPMVLNLDELNVSPYQTRCKRNPKYDEIKAGIRASGLRSVPLVTRDPSQPELGYFFSDGGNTRYSILKELWQETGEERFYRIHCLFKPFQGPLSCLLGHLRENEQRGEQTYIEKALGIKKARAFYEEQLDRTVTLRELSELLTTDGFPVHFSSISRMEDTVKYLYPFMSLFLEAGAGAPQIRNLLAIRGGAEKVWEQFADELAVNDSFTDVFGTVCSQFNDPDAYSLEMFRDELIGALVKALPHPSLNYDRWLLELDPKEQNRRQQLGELEHLQSVSNFAVQPMVEPPVDGAAAIPSSSSDALESGSAALTLNSALDDQENAGGESGDSSAEPETSSAPRIETQHDLYGSPPVLSGDVDEQRSPGMSGTETAGAGQPTQPGPAAPEVTPNAEGAEVAFAEEGLEPVVSVWAIPALQDDIEHLQGMAYRLAFELAEQAGCETELKADKATLTAAGYCLATQLSSPFTSLLLSLTGPAPANETCSLSEALIGAADGAGFPLLDDVHAVKFLRLVRVLRRLRELQRDVDTDTGEDA
ncbi:ParB family protein [Serratia marcescens]|uniref:ParB family protein n=1 Tax=Serratia marcescens TaxID=615 RepID=UPI003D6F65A6